ncbi:hypothetical protein [Pseudophaeobacter sp.]|uniref:hypothetical protein n=1 Tax=Pseudophaeobacter sp. TaxID=1971739 RepID=UPI0040587354
MLTDIYARSMLTATGQNCVPLRDLPAVPKAAQDLPKDLPQAYSLPPNRNGVFAKLAQLIRRLGAALRHVSHPVKRPVRCIDLQNL